MDIVINHFNSCGNKVKPKSRNFHSRTVHPDTITVFIYQLKHKKVALKILQFTLKYLLHVSVQSPSSGIVLSDLAKVIIIKIITTMYFNRLF